MMQLRKMKILSCTALGMGVAGMGLRSQLYRLGLDEKQLLIQGHPLEWALWVLTAAVVVLILTAVRNQKGSDRYADQFAPSFLDAVGHIFFAAGILLTVLLNEPLLRNHLGSIWQLLGFLSCPCLLLAAFARAAGKRPVFFLHLIPCLFLVLHIVNHYQSWSGDPQLQNYIFTLLGTMAMMLFAFHQAAFAVDSGKQPLYLGMGLAAVYLCTVSLSTTEHLFLYAGGILWLLTGLWSFRCGSPRPEEGESTHEAA